MTPKTGTLYGIGVGPGDPELITLKALKVLQRVPHIFASCSSKNNYSLALNIVRCHLNGAGIEHLPFPMTRDPQALKVAWEKNAQRVLEVLDAGADAAFVTLGDPLTYSTFGYLLKTLKRLQPEVRVVTIPGITSYSAAAALTQIPLTEGEESFYLVSGALGADRLREVVEKSDNIVMLKTYRNFGEIYQALEELDLLDRAVCISRCGLDGETVVENLRDLKGQDLSYLSMIIIKKRGRGY
jgi:precorrin-2/cobalt-factor-2 C20-methyltransferase